MQPASNHPADQAAIRQTVERLVDAWNKHDAHAYAMTFTEHCDFTSVFGTHVQGRPSNEALHAQLFSAALKDSHLTGQIRGIRFLTQDLAAVDVDWQMSGIKLPNASTQTEMRGLLNWVMARQADNSWLIEIFHNSDLTNAPRPAK